MSNIKTFPTSAKLMHWISALLIISLLFVSVSMIQSMAPWQHTVIKMHQSIGVLVFVLVLVRLVNRFFFTAPALPTDLSRL